MTLLNHEPVPDWIVFDDVKLILRVKTDEPEDRGEYKLTLTTNFHSFHGQTESLNFNLIANRAFIQQNVTVDQEDESVDEPIAE